MIARLALVAVLLLALVPTAVADWGADLDTETARRLLAELPKDLVPMLKADDAGRAERIERFVKRSGRGAIEVLKRVRNPELRPLFVALLDHDAWRVQHRALFVLEHYWDPETMIAAWKLLDHPNRRLREKAAITCIKLWDGSQGPGAVDALLAKETDFHVRRCLEALKRRAEGTLRVERLHQEVLATSEDGILFVPLLDGYETLATVAPDYSPRPVEETGKARTAKLPAADRWVGPLLAYGEEEVVGAGLQPFANISADGERYHVGEDAGACLDGAGLYAPAAGTVRLIRAGGANGTVLVVEHHLGASQLLNSVLMHGGDTVFVAAGDVVEAGQLLGTMGMSYSAENGGAFAHLHFGLYPGPFRADHAQAYQAVDAGLVGWMDPREFLPGAIQRTRPPVEVLAAGHPALEGVVARIGRDDLGQAYELLQRVIEAAEGDADILRDGTRLLESLELAPTAVERRARAWRDAGYPTEALRLMEHYARTCRGIPDADLLEETIQVWKADERFALALKGESKVESAEKKSATQRDAAKMRPTWEKLMKTYGDTVLGVRIERHLDG